MLTNVVRKTMMMSREDMWTIGEIKMIIILVMIGLSPIPIEVKDVEGKVEEVQVDKAINDTKIISI